MSLTQNMVVAFGVFFRFIIAVVFYFDRHRLYVYNVIVCLLNVSRAAKKETQKSEPAYTLVEM